MTRKYINTEAILRMQSALKLKPHTYEALALVSGLSRNSVVRWIKQLNEMTPRPVHIADYETDVRGRPFVLAWAWGDKPDAARPGRTSSKTAARMRAMRLRRKETAC